MGELNRPRRIRENGGDPIVDFAYDSAGRRVSSGWAAPTAYVYDPAGRLQTLSLNPAGTTRDHDLGFTYNPASQIHSRSASNPAYAWTGGSNLVRPYTVNGLNQYGAAGSATFGYDPNGNLASTANAPHTTAYVYDVENRLVSASGSHNATLTYDPLGRLASVTSGGWTRRLVYDGDALVGEYEPGGYMIHRYIHGNDAKADDPLIWYDNWNSGWRRALLSDHQGSVIQVADMYGNPIGTNTYDPWGIPGATPVGRFGYTGQTWVPELGLWYYKARFYSPTLGRFLQVDPIGYDDQINLYAYVGNDPVNNIDPDGQQATSIEQANEHDQRERLAGRMSEEEYQERQQARTNGGLIGMAIVGTVVVTRGLGLPAVAKWASGLFGRTPMTGAAANRAAAAALERAGLTGGNAQVGKIIGWGSGEAQALARIGQIDKAAVQGMREQGLTKEVVKAFREVYRSAVAEGTGVSAKTGANPAAARLKLMDRILRNW